MNFVRIFFQILITAMFYKRGFCPDSAIEYTLTLSSVDVWFQIGGPLLGNFASVELLKFKNSDMFFMRERDKNKSALRSAILQNTPFDMSQFELISMYESKLLFLLQREDKSFVYIFCQFSNSEDVQRFIGWVNPHKPRNRAIKISKISQYTINASSSNSVSQTLLPFTREAELSVRNIEDSLSVEKIVYYITHTRTTDGKQMVDLIFVSNGFKISAPYDNNIIALCVTHVPNLGFLVKFPPDENLAKFKTDYMFDAIQSRHPCNYPFLEPN